MFVTVAPANEPTGYYYEPHNVYDYRKAENADFLPYGVVVDDLSAPWDPMVVSLAPAVSGESGHPVPNLVFLVYFLMAFGLTYDEARAYQAKRRFSGMLGFVEYALALPFSAYKVGRGGKRGAVVFTGSLIDGLLDGKRTNLMVYGRNQLVAGVNFGVTESRPIKTASLDFYPQPSAGKQTQPRPTAGTAAKPKGMFTDKTVPSDEHYNSSKL